jgi:hypothetical protein
VNGASRFGGRLAGVAFVLFALRLGAAVALLPPWSGFDEPYHLGYARASADWIFWPRFRDIQMPPEVGAQMRRWPLPPVYARQYAGRTWGEPRNAPKRTAYERNYESQQSPLFYFVAGRILSLWPGSPAIAQLYLLRGVNAIFAFGVGLLTFLAARRLGFGAAAGLPVAFLALVPGFALSLTRLSNDALAALLMSGGVLLPLLSGGRERTASAAAAGLSPWAKLYGIAVLPGALLAAGRRGAGKGRLGRLALVAVPPALLAVGSWKIHGGVIALQESLRGAPGVPIGSVPWARDLWTIAKTHVFVAGMSFTVLPNAVYLAALAVIGAGLAATFRSKGFRGDAATKRRLAALALPLAVFGAALLYFCWRNFTYFRGPGGVGGWYAWALALPEALLVCWAASESRGAWPPAAAAFFLALTILADAVLFLEASGALKRTARGHAVGVERPAGTILRGFLASRPPAAAWAALALSLASWAVGAALVVELSARSHRERV